MFFGRDFISVTKSEDMDWDVRLFCFFLLLDKCILANTWTGQLISYVSCLWQLQALKAEIFATIMDFYATGEAVMSDEPIVTVCCPLVTLFY